jgi:DNA-binding winged helix-turn-helix (wHTH) protein/dipeptidyl aminopeptidase/acylaminoacyl peptidase
MHAGAAAVLYRFGDCEVDALRFELRRRGEAVPIEPQVFELLSYLLEHRSRVVTRAELNDVVWKGRVVTDAALNSRIKAARSAIGDDGKSQSSIKTLHRTGYRFVGPVEVLPAQSAGHAPTAPALDELRGNTPVPPPRRVAFGPGAWVGAAAFVAVAAFGTLRLASDIPTTLPAEAIQLSIPDVGPPVRMPFGVRRLAISADGSRIAYASRTHLWIRRLSESTPVTVESTTPMDPFFSPDGEWVGFFNARGLLKVRSSGGVPLLVAPVTERPAGAAWGKDGVIVFTTMRGLFRVASEGGEPELIGQPNAAQGERLYAWPALLSNPAGVLLTVFADAPGSAAQLVHLDLDTRERSTVLADAAAAQVLPGGYLVYAARETLNVVEFDPRLHRARGNARAVPGYRVAMAPDNGAAEFALADNGTLVLLPPGNTEESLRRLVLVDHDGTRRPLGFEPRPYIYPRFSPDGRRLALDILGANRDIWIADLDRGDVMRLSTGPTEDMMAVWSPDGRRVFFASDRTGTFDVYSQPADGSAEARPELVAPDFQTPMAITPDGKHLVVYENYRDISLVDLQPSRIEPLLAGDIGPHLAEFSPDGKFLAYESAEAGSVTEVFVRPFPDVHAWREKVSTGGGRFPRWGPRGSGELYYVAPDGALLAVAVAFEPRFSLGNATRLFAVDEPLPQASGWPYDVSPQDGRFVMTELADQAAKTVTDVTVVLNWTSELRIPRR